MKENHLAKESHQSHLSDWRSYRGIARMIEDARNIVKTGQIDLINLMKGHESQQSASLVASIAIVIANIITKERLKISYSSKKFLQTFAFGK